MIADTPPPPYYAVIFTSIRSDDPEDTPRWPSHVHDGRSTARLFGDRISPEEVGITVSYWKDMKSIQQWKQHSDHIVAQKQGRERWYSQYRTRICRVERDYEFAT